MRERVIASSEDDNLVLWETVEYLDADGNVIGGGVRAVCRPVSCPGGEHRCGKLALGLERDDAVARQTAADESALHRFVRGIGRVGPGFS